MKFIPFSVNSGKNNMEIDEEILNNAINTQSKDAIFRLYAWNPPCISLGRNQSDNFLDTKLLTKYGIDVVRRLTGGRALFHDKEITYSFVCPENYLKSGGSVIESYKEISQILIDTFQTLGIELSLGGEKGIHTKFDYCMLISTGADLCYNGRKFIGSAQCRKNGYILQHGSILLDYNREFLEELFKEKVTTDSIISLKEINPKISAQKIIDAFELKLISQNYKLY